MDLVYLDASAIVKLVAEEPESNAVQGWLVDRRPSVSRIGAVETIRAAVRHGMVDQGRVREVIDSLELIELTSDIVDRAGTLEPASLRTLDAIHLASALALGDDLDTIVTYDERMAAGALAVGLPVEAPR